MPVLKHTCRVDLVPYLVQFTQQLVRIVGDSVVVVPYRQVCSFQYIDYQHRMMCSQGASALGDDARLRQVIFDAHIHERRHRVVDIFLYGIVHRVLAHRGAGAVIVHAQTAANIDKIDVEAHLEELYIELHRLTQGSLDAAYLGNLAADVEMNEFQRVGHLVPAQELDGVEQFA